MLEKKLKAIMDIDDVVSMCRHNFPIITDCINDNTFDIKELFRKNSRKASKLSLLLVVVAGITYAIHNECEKTIVKEQLIELDKRQRGLNTFQSEDEGEAMDPI